MLQSIDDYVHQLQLPQWLTTSTPQTVKMGLLNCQQTTGLLFHLVTSSNDIRQVFNRYATENRMSFDGWLAFVQAEQGKESDVDIDDHVSDAPPPEVDLLSNARQQISQAIDLKGHAHQRESTLNPLQFAFQLLSKQNNAVASAQGTQVETSYLNRPLTHYWNATSHNSYVVGNQLTGLSSADAYRRQLLQGCRHVEIDCWDGRKEPVVTHGRTFCSLERFEAVAQAVVDCSFVTSSLPVILSLEMHCSPEQQVVLASTLVTGLGQRLLPYHELAEMDDAVSLSLLDLASRCLVKGKVKPAKQRSSTLSKVAVTRPRRSRFSRTSSMFLRSSTASIPSTPDFRKSSARSVDENEAAADVREGRATLPTCRVDEEMATDARHTLDQQRSRVRIRTDERYARILGLRSHPCSAFFKDESPKWVLPISSINEDKLLIKLGIADSERNLIEGLHAGRGVLGRTGGASSAPALARLAANPPPQVFNVQRRTLAWLLRPYPEGLRFSGNNMSPQPGWLAGAHSVALNMSNVDLPLTLHFALFNGSGGFTLKPQEMRIEGTFWPPSRVQLVRTTVDILSLHNLPKRGERRPSLEGSRGACHKHHEQELSGTSSPPNLVGPSSPAITLAIHPIGGVCAISRQLPVLQSAETEVTTDAVVCNGLNSHFTTTVHCVAAEPHATFLRVAVIDRGQEVAYETVVLGRLRRGYRVLLLRSELGTRIECCYLLVRVERATE